jgi:5-(carboxyamino)imidazole ribonucleotide synthase
MSAPLPPSSSPLPLAPGAWLGLLGGGQLGRMFCMAAQSLGFKVAVLDPAGDSPAGSVADRHIQADYLDAQGLQALAASCSAVTTEFENVPAQSLRQLARTCAVSPTADSVSTAQDRIAEKQFVLDCGVEVAPHAAIRSAADLEQAPSHLYPGILKVARLGYDGKGQARVASLQEAQHAFAQFGGVACVLEQMLALDYEISVVVARGRDGATVTYPVAQNLHRDGILAISSVPAASAGPAIAGGAAEAALRIVRGLDYVGVLCVEFFVLRDGRLLVNEIAPRPHNSGHYSIDACVTSQFEQQARVMAGLPLGDPGLMAPAVMLNLLGDAWQGPDGQRREPDWPAVLAVPGAKLHLYGKSDARPGRKMGHVTCLGTTPAEASAAAGQVAAVLGIAYP